MKSSEANIKLELLNKVTESDIKLQKIKRQIIINTLISFIILSFIFSLVLTCYISSKLKYKHLDKEIFNILYSKNFLIYDEKNIPVAVGNNKNYQIYLSPEEISPYLKKEIVLLQDKSFYQTKGLNLSYLISNVLNLMHNKPIDKETISTKLVKSFPSECKNILNKKLFQIIYSLDLEHKFSKDQIITIYLNNISLKNTGKGLDENSKLYFGKFASELNQEESELFVLMLFGKGQLEKITPRDNISKYSYFIDYSIAEAKDLTHCSNLNGLKIYTKLNRKLQIKSEDVIKKRLTQISINNKQTQSAVLLTDTNSSSIITIIGGKDFIKGDFNRAYQSKRNIGSTFKPIIYLIALEKGLITPKTIFKDEPVEFMGNKQSWKPRNWDGKYLGNIDIQQSIALSRNTVAIKLASQIGVKELINKSRQLGITDKLPENLTISIGSASLTLKELTGIYSTFGREGLYINPHAVNKIQIGKIILTPNIQKKQVIEKAPTRELNKILSTTLDKEIVQDFNKQKIMVSGKTGTSDESKDLWFAGYNKDLTGIVWIGNDKNKPMNDIYSKSCAEIWADLAKNYYYSSLDSNKSRY
ncbi:MAG: penicillin-binding transpeptidase domain-containing protein [bacterium]